MVAQWVALSSNSNNIRGLIPRLDFMGPFCVKFTFSANIYMGFLRELWLSPTGRISSIGKHWTQSEPHLPPTIHKNSPETHTKQSIYKTLAYIAFINIYSIPNPPGRAFTIFLSWAISRASQSLSSVQVHSGSRLNLGISIYKFANIRTQIPGQKTGCFRCWKVHDHKRKTAMSSTLLSPDLLFL